MWIHEFLHGLFMYEAWTKVKSIGNEALRNSGESESQLGSSRGPKLLQDLVGPNPENEDTGFQTNQKRIETC